MPRQGRTTAVARRLSAPYAVIVKLLEFWCGWWEVIVGRIHQSEGKEHLPLLYFIRRKMLWVTVSLRHALRSACFMLLYTLLENEDTPADSPSGWGAQL